MIDLFTFFRDWPSRFPAFPLTAARREALTLVLLMVERADELTKTHAVRRLAYKLATLLHETAGTCRPITEYRGKPGTKHRQLQDRYWSTGFYGRGYVQLTWDRNYAKMTVRLHAFGLLPIWVDLVATPDLALDPWVAWCVLTEGMDHGLFTGKALDAYITGATTDYVNARRVVNGTDQAERIAGYASAFELLLRASWPAEGVATMATPAKVAA